MSCMSTMLPPSAVFVSQSISKGKDVWLTCDGSTGVGLLLAMYVEPLAAGQLGDACADDVDVIVDKSIDWVTVMGALSALLVVALLEKRVIVSIWKCGRCVLGHESLPG